MGGTKPQGIFRAVQTVLARLMESQLWNPLAGSGSLGGGFRKGTMPSSLLVWEKTVPPFLMSDTSVPPCMPLVPFEALPQCWSSCGVNLSKSVCGFFKRSCLGLQKFLLLTQSPLVFAARSYGDLSSWHWNPGLSGLV